MEVRNEYGYWKAPESGGRMRLKWLFRAVVAVAALAPCLLGLQVLGPAASAATLSTVTSVSPNTGSFAGGTNVVISGTGFTGATEVLFGGIAAPSFSVVDDSEITATSPSQPVGTVDVSVLTPAGGSAATSADSFTYELGPRISGISPQVSPTSGGTTVTLTGTGFTGATSVTFNGAVATNLTVVSDTQLTVTTPPQSAGGVDVTVFTPNGTDTTTLFAYADTPVVSGISPSSGPANGGTSVYITGSGFTGANQVSFGSVGSAGLEVLSDTTMVAGVPAQAEGDIVDVTVTNPAGTSATSAADQFTYTAPVTTATALSPSIGGTAGGTRVTVDGTEFVAGQTSVTIGGTVIPSASVTVQNANVLTFITPAHAAGSVSVTVTAPDGTSAPVPGGFSYQPPPPPPVIPVVTAVSPSSGSTVGGTSVTIIGTGFTFVTSVSFGSVRATSYLVTSPTSITAVAPAGSAGTVDVRVASKLTNISPISAADHFTYQVPAPVCTTTVTGTHSTRLTVSSGLTCLVGADQTGSVTVAAGASLSVTNSTVNGTVTATSPGAITYCGSTEYGELSVSGATGAVTLGDGGACAADNIPSTISITGATGSVTVNGLKENGTLTLSGDTGGVTLSTSSVNGPVYVENNAGPSVTVAGNTVIGSLYCTANNPAPTDNGSINTVSGTATSQCADIATR